MNVIIRFHRRNGIINRLIQWFTWSWADHIDTLLPPSEQDTSIGADTPGGVSYYKAGRTSGEVRYARLELTVEQSSRYYQFLRSQVGKGYDWGAILGFVFRRNWADPGKWFCSELIAAACEDAGVPLVDKDLRRVTPGDLMASVMLVEIDPRTGQPIK